MAFALQLPDRSADATFQEGTLMLAALLFSIAAHPLRYSHEAPWQAFWN
ncbi:MAG: hypothetical protein ACRD3J_11650 [Thermoanaerobaculia bacterium]